MSDQTDKFVAVEMWTEGWQDREEANCVLARRQADALEANLAYDLEVKERKSFEGWFEKQEASLGDRGW